MRAGSRLLGPIMQCLKSGELVAEHIILCEPPHLVVSQLTSLRPLQAAKFSAYKRSPPEDEAEDALDIKQMSRKGHLPRVSGHALVSRVSESAALVADSGARAAAVELRRDKMRDLARSIAATKGKNRDELGTFKFLDDFFGSGTAPPAAATGPLDVAISGSGEFLGAEQMVEDDEFEIDTLEQLSGEQESEILEELRGLRRGSQRVVLQKLLQGGMLRADPTAMAEWEEIQKAFTPPEGFRMKVVDINRTCKGTRSGGLYRFSAMVVVGNGEGVLGWGQGKAPEINEAVKKAYHRACRNLYPIPRYNGHTIPERVEAEFGKVKVVMYPKSAGRGVVASSLVTDICKMAGIHDIGVKVHGSRNPRNTVKCLFEAFDVMKTHEEIINVDGIGVGDTVTVAVPPGRFGKLAF